jgi:predicted RNA-binding protein associated with RNAse of E/G family
LNSITIHKLDHNGTEVWNYPGEVIQRDREKVVVKARFTKDDFVFNGMLLKKDDLFLEAYYRLKWYNIYEIYDRDDGLLKGWYCNITRPPVINRWKITYQDLALDLLVHFHGESILLDEDEFKEIGLTTIEVENAWNAVREVQRILSDQRFRLKRN